MATNKFLTFLSNATQLVTAISNSTGVPDANKIIATSTDGRIDSSLMPAGIGAATEVMVASEVLAAGDFVNIWNDSGTRKARKADASNGRAAMGFTLAAVGVNGSATIVLQGINTGLTGLTPGTLYFLSATAAGTTATTAPTTAGHIIQYLGNSVSATGINFEYDRPITIA